MNKIKQHIYKAMLWLLPWLCAVPLASCSFDDDIDTGDDNAPAMLQLSITAREEGDLNTREGTEVGQNSEYMHNLLVLFIQGDKVVKKFLPDLSNDGAAKVGNLKTWTSESFTLTPGTYTVYAFANIDSYFSTAWSSLTGLGDGESLTEKGIDIDNIVLEDNPASKLDLLTYFIPMSAKEEVTVTRSTRNISIGLDRLVTKIRMSITGKPNTKVTALSFGGYADKIGLFSDKILDGEAYTTTKTINIPGDGTLKADGTGTTGTLVIPDFYVNSSPVGHPFTVKIKTVEATGIIHDATAVTQRNELPRNSIFPLTLQLNDYGLDLEAQCWVSPIGSLPVEVTVGFTQDTYEITVPEGCQFAFTVKGININGGNTSNITNLTGTWNMPDGVSGIAFDGETTGVTTVKGHVTASAGKTFDLSLLVTWQDNGATYNRTYTVKVLTDDITNFPFKSKTRTPEFGLDYLRHEMLNMFIK
ncbi:hypothetical protein [Xylanibacter rarus]|uniref:Major fimbrial subunit protein N-terminal domain-containing protein n=1 Tax=Xylanibacter rarus TaxID=1676614 RepID=A0A8E1R0T3_9BACT|nr:hypothetical protein [Xylanibacter rarus]KOO69429.1 hypothetical protein ACU52_01825 [Xylanibacter rarus]